MPIVRRSALILVQAGVTNFAHAAKDGQTKVGLTGFLGGDTADHFGSILKGLCDMERRLCVPASPPRWTMKVSWEARLLVCC